MNRARWNMMLGGFWFFSGTAAAFVTYDAAVLTPGYIAAWGTIILGAVQLARGVAQLAGE